MMFELPVSRMRGNYFPNSALRRAGGRGRLNLWLIPNHAGNDLFLRLRQSIIPGATPRGLKKWLCSNHGGLVDFVGVFL